MLYQIKNTTTPTFKYRNFSDNIAAVRNIFKIKNFLEISSGRITLFRCIRSGRVFWVPSGTL